MNDKEQIQFYLDRLRSEDCKIVIANVEAVVIHALSEGVESMITKFKNLAQQDIASIIMLATLGLSVARLDQGLPPGKRLAESIADTLTKKDE